MDFEQLRFQHLKRARTRGEGLRNPILQKPTLQTSIHSDTLRRVNTFVRSSDFDAWLSNLADQKAKARILARLRSATFGNFGDCEPVGEGVSEMRIHVGAGYRVYYTRTGSTIYVLLAGGVKASQTKDIAKAKRMARELKRSK